MKGKKFVSLIIAAAMTFSLATTAFAASNEADGPQGDTLGDRPSLGKSTITVNSNGDWITDSDDNDQTGGQSNDGYGSADIGVWAKIVDLDSEALIYCIDIEWGAMKFVFGKDGSTWDPVTHTYSTIDPGSWWESSKEPLVTESYLDGYNNEVIVINRSNGAVDAEFDYAFFSQFDGTAGGSDSNNLFNKTATTANRVVGNFFEDNDNAQLASLLLTDSQITSGIAGSVGYPTDTGGANLNALTMTPAEIRLTSAADVAYNDPDTLDEPNTGRVYFAFSGTPDTDSSLLNASFTKVGVITVTITPVTNP